MSRHHVTTRHKAKDLEHSDLSSFHILVIISPIDIKFDDSSCSKKITQRYRTFMKELLRFKVIWMDKITLEVTTFVKEDDSS